MSTTLPTFNPTELDNVADFVRDPSLKPHNRAVLEPLLHQGRELLLDIAKYNSGEITSLADRLRNLHEKLAVVFNMNASTRGNGSEWI